MSRSKRKQVIRKRKRWLKLIGERWGPRGAGGRVGKSAANLTRKFPECVEMETLRGTKT